MSTTAKRTDRPAHASVHAPGAARSARSSSGGSGARHPGASANGRRPAKAGRGTPAASNGRAPAKRPKAHAEGAEGAAGRAEGAAGRAKGVAGGRGQGGRRLADAFVAVEGLPALKVARDRALSLASVAAPATDDLADAVESDPALAIAVLREANGAGRGSFGSVAQAIQSLGPQAVAGVIERIAVYDFFEPAGDWGDLPERFRRHAVATRRAVDQVGELGRMPGRDELAVAALLHDIGRLVLRRLYGAYDEVIGSANTAEQRIHLERRELGIDHALVGGVLARRWRLGNQVATAIERHHTAGSPAQAAAVGLADAIAHHAHGEAVSAEHCMNRAADLGITADRLRALLYEFPYRRLERRRSSEPCPLSERELDALSGLADGKVYKEIAGEMGLSASTVRTHLHNVYRKIGAVDRAQAVLLARDRGWV